MFVDRSSVKQAIRAEPTGYWLNVCIVVLWLRSSQQSHISVNSNRQYIGMNCICVRLIKALTQWASLLHSFNTTVFISSAADGGEYEIV